MKILGIDTSTEVLGLAITEDDNLISEARYVIKRAHAERLITAVADLLSASRLALDDLEGISISIGPGSFTGLRIGLAAVKGLVFGRNIPVAGVSTLEVLAHCGRFWNGEIRPLIRAQADEAYTAAFREDGGELVMKQGARLIAMDELETVVAEKTLLIISGFKSYQDYITPKVKEKVSIALPQDSMISGFTVARLGWQRFENNQVDAVENLEPFYLKEFKAKKKIGL